MKRVIVTGANGQLGQSIKDIEYSGLEFIYVDKDELDITDGIQVVQFFSQYKIDWCINCAAYTAVDKAESDSKPAYAINETGVANLAQACKTHSVKFIHISTDFVFDGTATIPYTEEDTTNPLGIYGDSKLKGEQATSFLLDQYFIIRTSWLYSEHGNNFMKTMLMLSETREQLNIVADQIGTPTYAKDLAKAILSVICSNSKQYGIYHYSNEGVTSWYDFAKAIFQLSEKPIKTIPIPSSDYPTPAKRPHYSVLDKTKFREEFKIEIPHWTDSLKIAITQIK